MAPAPALKNLTSRSTASCRPTKRCQKFDVYDRHAVVEGLEVFVVGVEHVADDEAGGSAVAVAEEVEADVDQGAADVEADQAGGERRQRRAGGGTGRRSSLGRGGGPGSGGRRGGREWTGSAGRGGVEVEEAPTANAGVAGCLPGLVALRVRLLDVVRVHGETDVGLGEPEVVIGESSTYNRVEMRLDVVGLAGRCSPGGAPGRPLCP